MKHLISAGVAVVIVAAIAVFAWTLITALWWSPSTEIAVPPAQIPPATLNATSTYPVKLVIPSLSINADVQRVGLKHDGSMGTPNNFTDVAWYKYGTTPGQTGSAVIDGHVDNGLGLDGVFKHLSDIQVGDDVYVVEKNGTKLHFMVTDIEIYPYKSAPTERIFEQGDTARLNLITCDGTWVRGGDTYNERLVVYTELQAT